LPKSAFERSKYAPAGFSFLKKTGNRQLTAFESARVRREFLSRLERVTNGDIVALAGIQRSRVANLVVAFNQPVQLDADALTIALHTNTVAFGGVPMSAGFGVVPTALNLSTSDNVTWTVSFAGNSEGGSDGIRSLKDGVYDLKISAATVHPLGRVGARHARRSNRDIPLSLWRLGFAGNTGRRHGRRRFCGRRLPTF
jgi:hypothetical protein